MLLTKSITVACGRGGVICRAVALNRQNEATRFPWVLRHKINAVSRCSPLLENRNASVLQGVTDVTLEGI